MKILCIQHADFETPGVVQAWAKANKHSFQILKPYGGDPFPGGGEFDFIISMGGPQSPRDASHLPYLKEEINFLKNAISANKHVLGFCLGAQLIGEALGAQTQKSPHREVGVFPITLTPEGQKDPLFYDFPASFPVIHWHSDMPGKTKDATLLASSEGCPYQGYRYQKRVYGLQFHMEITKTGIEDLISCVPDDLNPGLFIQSREELLNHNYELIHQHMYTVLDRLITL